jgi:hypothetical protein
MGWVREIDSCVCSNTLPTQVPYEVASMHAHPFLYPTRARARASLIHRNSPRREPSGGPGRLKRRQSSYSKKAAPAQGHGLLGGPRSGYTFIWAVAIVAVVGLLVYSLRTLVPKAKLVDTMRTMPTPSILKNHCEEHIGPPRVIRVRLDDRTNGWVTH